MSTLTSRLIVKVQQSNGYAEQLIGRAAAMALWLTVYADQINETRHGKVTFEWDGVAMRPHLYRTFEHINTDSLMPLSDGSTT